MRLLPRGSTDHTELPTSAGVALSRRPHPSDEQHEHGMLDGVPAPVGWLWGGSRAVDTAELAELRERLLAAEARAAEAEAALPHLLALGQRTVNALLSDARARSSKILEDAESRSSAMLEASRAQVESEARDLETLRMAVVAEAMCLEQVRLELQQRVRITAAELARVAGHPLVFGNGAVYADPSSSGALPAPVVASVGPPPLPPPPAPAELEDAGMPVTSSPLEAAPATGFANAWSVVEDEEAEAAFERFFTADLGDDPDTAGGAWVFVHDGAG